jgi:uncharacterized protein (DUF1330 family)
MTMRPGPAKPFAGPSSFERSATLPAYLIVDTAIENATAYEEYKAQARPMAERFGGEYLARGGALDVVECDLWTPTRLVVIRFPDMASARTFLDSPEYAPLRKIRRANARCTLALVEGL